MAPRSQPSTIDLQRQGRQDIRQQSKNEAESKKGGGQKFNTGIDLNAVFGSLSQLFQAFSGKQIENTSLNMTLFLRSVYKNLSSDLVNALCNSKNVQLLESQMSKASGESKGGSALTAKDVDMLTTMADFLNSLKESAKEVKDELEGMGFQAKASDSQVKEFFRKQQEMLHSASERALEEARQRQSVAETVESAPGEEPSGKPQVTLEHKPVDKIPVDFPLTNVKVIVATPALTKELLNKLGIAQKALQNSIESAGYPNPTVSSGGTVSSGPVASKGGGQGVAAPAAVQEKKQPAIFRAAKQTTQALNQKMGATPKASGKAGNNVSIAKDQFNKLMGLAGQQEKVAANANAEGNKTDKDGGKSPGLGNLGGQKKMSDAEAFQKNITEGYTYLQKALGEKNMAKITLPSKQIASAIKGYFKSTADIVQDADSNLDSVENQLTKPNKKNLIFGLKGWIIKVVLGGLLAVTMVNWLRNNIMSWMPRGQDGNILHGPTIFGVKMPNFKDMMNIGKSMFLMVKTGLGKIIRYIAGEVKFFMNSQDIKGAGGILTFMKNFAIGYISGKALAKADKILGFFEDILMAFPVTAGILGTIKMAIRLISVVAGALTAAINDWLKGKRDDSGLTADAVKWGEDKVNELIGENMHGTRAGKVLVSKASKIKPMVPVQNLLPESMKAKDASGKIKVKALIPNLPVVNLATGTMSDEQDDINNVAKERRREKMKSSGQTGMSQIDKSLASQPEVQWDSKYGDPSPKKLATLKLMAYAQKNIDVLTQQRKKINGNFDGPPLTVYAPWSDPDRWVNYKQTNAPWRPEWQYSNRKDLLQSIMPPEPFGDSTKGTKYTIAEPWNHEVMGVLPLGVRVPSTNAAWVVDALAWERDRLDIGIDAWKGVVAWIDEYIDSGDENDLIGGKRFIERLTDGGLGYKGGEDWARISTKPNSNSRIRSDRKSDMVDEFNRWNEKHGKTKQKVKEIKEDIQAQRQKDAGESMPPPPKKTGPSLVSRFWTRAKSAAGSLVGKAKDAFNKGGIFGLAKAAGRGFLSLFNKKEVKEPPKPPKPPSQGIDYINGILGTPFWKSLSKDGVKADELRRTLAVDKWFDIQPPKDDKVYQTEVGKMFYNILIKMGFQYDKVVWQNPQFMQVRPKVMPQMVDSLNNYLYSLVQPHGAYLMALLGWAKAHQTKEEQDAVLAAAQKEVKELGNNVNRNKFWEFVAANYIPTDMHLVVRDKDGKIIREEGKQLKGLSIPKEIFDQDPAYWSNVMELLNQTAIPPQDLAELQTRRAETVKLLNMATAGIKRMQWELRVEQNWMAFAKQIEQNILARRVKMFTWDVADIKSRVLYSKREILMYFKYRRWVDTGSWWALDDFAYWGDWLNRWAKWNIFGSKLWNAESLGQKMLGSVREIIRDRRTLIKKMRAIIQKILEQNQGMKQAEDEDRLSIVRSVFNKVAGVYERFVQDKINRGVRIAKFIARAARLNFGLFSLFNRKKSQEKQLEVQVNEMAKEMVPEGDVEGKERLKNIMQLAQERKDAAKNDRKSWTGYWREMRRKWQDKISVESMTELKNVSLRLSNNIYEYMGLVKEIPVGNTLISSSGSSQETPVYKLMPDVTF